MLSEQYFANLGGTAEASLSSLVIGMKGFFYCFGFIVHIISFTERSLSTNICQLLASPDDK